MIKTWSEQGGGAFPLPPSTQGDIELGMTLRDYFAGQAGDPPSEFVKAYREAVPMDRIRYTYGCVDDDRSARRHDQKLISEYQANLRAAWAYAIADAMLEARK